MELLEGGIPGPGTPVEIDHAGRGREAVVVASGFKTHVFRGDVSVRYTDGTMDLVPAERVRRSAPDTTGAAP